MTTNPMWRRVRELLGTSVAADVDDELLYHIDARAKDLEKTGLSPEAARAEALRRFGDLETVRREVEQMDEQTLSSRRRVEWLSELGQDTRFGLRMLRRSPGFALAAVGTLALAIGANAAVFSVVNSVLLRPLPYGDPDRLVMLWEQNPERDWYMQTAAPANMLDWRERVPAFTDVAGYADFEDRLTVVGSGDPVSLRGRNVTGNFFSVLGIQPAMGRLLAEEETWSTSEPVVVVSHRAWRENFGARPDLVGQRVQLNGAPATVVGVLPESFRLPGVDADLWRPIRWEPSAVNETSFRRAHYLRVIARLAPGATPELATSQLTEVARALESEYPGTNRLMGAGLTPLQEFLVGDVGATLRFLQGAVAVLLLLACANVGNLLLTRSLGRRRELAVRGALGAGRRRLLRQMIVEGTVLAILATTAGALLAWAAVRFIAIYGTSPLLADLSLSIDARFLSFLLLVVGVGAIAVTVASAGSRSPDSNLEALRTGTRSGGADRSGRRTARWLVTAEVGMALLLLAGATLLARSFFAVQQVDPGFDSGGVYTAGLNVPASRYESDERVLGFYRDYLERVRALPGVEHAAFVRQLPLTTASWSSDFFIEGRLPDQYGVEVVHREATPGYFETMRVPLLRGRLLEETDGPDAERVIVINEELARTYFPDEDPIGQRIAFSRAPAADAVWWTVVGVVGSEIQGSPADGARIEIFAPISQAVTRGVSLVVRTGQPPSTLALPLQRLTRELDPELVLVDGRSLDRVRSEAVARERFTMALLLGFSLVAVVLAMVGVYGVIAQATRNRHREIGIRIALGATLRDLLSAGTRESLRLIGGGLAIGLMATLLLAGAVESLVYGVSPRDPATLGAATLVLLVSGLVAASIPILRSSRTPPSSVLRED